MADIFRVISFSYFLFFLLFVAGRLAVFVYS